jgi:3-deoxy-D-manno-octulosonic-acid transferase
MYLLYSLALTLGISVLIPRFLWDAVRHGKYVEGLAERVGFLSPLIKASSGGTIWLHCVSVGETMAARPLVKALINRDPSLNLVISTTTLTGQKVAGELFGDVAAAVIYFPFDWRWCVKRALRRVSPSLVLVMETEIWPNFLRECEQRKVPVAIVNGRLSATSFRRYRVVGKFIRRVLNGVTLAVMQTTEDAARIGSLGITQDRVLVSGNVKFDLGVDSSVDPLLNEIKQRFDLGDGPPLIIAASTHSPEERIFLDAFKELKKRFGATAPRLLIAPRHPERFNEVEALIKAAGLTWCRRSAVPQDSDRKAEVILLDTIGELRSTYSLGDLVFVGGSIARHGGHNVLEPAAAGACVVTGAHTDNFAEIVSLMLKEGALLQLPEDLGRDQSVAIASTIAELLLDEVKRKRLGVSALKVVEDNRGATERTIHLLAPLLPPTPVAKQFEKSSPEGSVAF